MPALRSSTIPAKGSSPSIVLEQPGVPRQRRLLDGDGRDRERSARGESDHRCERDPAGAHLQAQYSGAMVLGLLLLALQASPAALPENPTALPEMLKKAMQLLEASDRASARRELTEALRSTPRAPRVRNFLGVVEAGDGNYSAAERRFQEAVRLTPHYTDAYLNLGRLYQASGGHDPLAATKALAAYQAILGYDPAHADARFQSAALLLSTGEFSRSLAELDRLAPADQGPAGRARRPHRRARRQGRAAEADAATERLLARGGLRRAGRATDAGRPRRAWARGSGGAPARGPASPRTRLVRRLAAPRTPAEEAGEYVEGRVRLEEASQGPAGQRSAPARPRSRGAQGQATSKAPSATSATPGRSSLGTPACTFCSAWPASSWSSASRPTTPSRRRSGSTLRTQPLTTPWERSAFTARTRAKPSPISANTRSSSPASHAAPLALGVAAFQVKDYATARARLGLLRPGRRPRPPPTTTWPGWLAPKPSSRKPSASPCAPWRPTCPTPIPGPSLACCTCAWDSRRRTAEALERCLKLDPDYYLGNLHLTMLYSETRDPREASATPSLRRDQGPASRGRGRLPAPDRGPTLLRTTTLRSQARVCRASRGIPPS